MKMRSKADLVSIARAGGGFRLDAKMRSTADLISIARAASSGGGTIILCGMKMRSTADLVSIGRAGAGHVVFEE